MSRRALDTPPQVRQRRNDAHLALRIDRLPARPRRTRRGRSCASDWRRSDFVCGISFACHYSNSRERVEIALVLPQIVCH